jgi:hypothetical protein
MHKGVHEGVYEGVHKAKYTVTDIDDVKISRSKTALTRRVCIRVYRKLDLRVCTRLSIL